MAIRVFPLLASERVTIGSLTATRSDFGDPRRGPPAHTHQGNDLYVRLGAPVLAVDDGRVDFGDDRLGGHHANLTTTDGERIFYAHLNAWEGSARTVAAGEVLGYAGNSGNAAGGPVHVHFEEHPHGGAAVDPFAALMAAPRLDTPTVAPSSPSSGGSPTAPGGFRMVKPGYGATRPLVLSYEPHDGTTADRELVAASPASACILVALSPVTTPLQTVIADLGVPVSPVVVCGFSAGGITTRALLAGGGDPDALVIADGTYGTQPIAWVYWDAYAKRARKGERVMLASYTSYVIPSSPWHVLKAITGWDLPLGAPTPGRPPETPVVPNPPDVARFQEGNLVVYGYGSTWSHERQGSEVLPKMLAEAFRMLGMSAPGPSPEPPPSEYEPPSLELAAKALLGAWSDKHEGTPAPERLAYALGWAYSVEGSFTRVLRGTNNWGSMHATGVFVKAHAHDHGYGMVAFSDSDEHGLFITRLQVFPSLLLGARAYLDLVEPMIGDWGAIGNETDYATALYVHGYYGGKYAPRTPLADRAKAAADGTLTQADLENIAAGTEALVRGMSKASAAIASAPTSPGDPSVPTFGPPFASLASRLTPSSAYAPHTLEHARELLGARAERAPFKGAITLPEALDAPGPPPGDGVWMFPLPEHVTPPPPAAARRAGSFIGAALGTLAIAGAIYAGSR